MVENKSRKNLGGGERSNTVDLFKCILMIMIVAQHAIVHGMGLKNIVDNNVSRNYSLVWFVANSFLAISVNCFFWISGYFRIRLRWKRIAELIAETVMYIFILNVLLLIIDTSEFQIIFILKIIKRCFCFYSEGYWFLVAYLLVSLASPYLNMVVDNLNIAEKKKLACGLFLTFSICGFLFKIEGLSNAYTVWQGIYMYMLGTLVNVNFSYKGKNRKVIAIVFLMLVLFGNGIVSYFLYLRGNGNSAWRLFSYNSPILVVAAIILCNLIVNEKNIAYSFYKISGHSLAVYLLTDYPLVRSIIFKPIFFLSEKYSSSIVLISILVYSTLLMIVCAEIDVVRKVMYDNTIIQLKQIWKNCDKLKLRKM